MCACVCVCVRACVCVCVMYINIAQSLGNGMDMAVAWHEQNFDVTTALLVVFLNRCTRTCELTNTILL